MEVSVKTNLKEFRQARRKEVAARLSQSGKHCRDAIGVYYKWLAQFTPPSTGREEIDLHLYQRTAMLLPIAIARGSRENAADRAALQQGFSWKVAGKKGKVKYFKGRGKDGNVPPPVKKARHIVNRGLLRWAFLGVLPDVGVAVPVKMRQLAQAKKGKNLKKNESFVATATLAVTPNELIIRVQQHVAFAGKAGWFDRAARIAEEQHDYYLKQMLKRFGKVQTR